MVQVHLPVLLESATNVINQGTGRMLVPMQTPQLLLVREVQVRQEERMMYVINALRQVTGQVHVQTPRVRRNGAAQPND